MKESRNMLYKMAVVGYFTTFNKNGKQESQKFKVFVCKNFEKTNTQAQNKFLKTLEEPPKNVVFLLLTTDIKSVLKTIVSRCKLVNVRSLTQDESGEYYGYQSEGICK